MSRRKSLPTVKQLCEGVNPESPVEHVIVCPVCGQMFDGRDQDHVAHHTQGEHGPKLG